MKVVLLCRGKPANTATVVTYTLGFSAAALVAGLAYFYAKRALRKIEQRAQQQDAALPPPTLQDNSTTQSRTKSSLQDLHIQEGLIRQHSQEPMLAQQQNSFLRTDSVDSDSPSAPNSMSPSRRRLLPTSNRFAADIESSPV